MAETYSGILDLPSFKSTTKVKTQVIFLIDFQIKTVTGYHSTTKMEVHVKVTQLELHVSGYYFFTIASINHIGLFHIQHMYIVIAGLRLGRGTRGSLPTFIIIMYSLDATILS